MLPVATISETFYNKTNRLESINKTEPFSKAAALALSVLSLTTLSIGITAIVIKSPHLILGGYLAFFFSASGAVSLYKFNFKRSKEKKELISEITIEKLAEQLRNLKDKEEQKSFIEALEDKNRIQEIPLIMNKTNRDNFNNILTQLEDSLNSE